MSMSVPAVTSTGKVLLSQETTTLSLEVPIYDITPPVMSISVPPDTLTGLVELSHAITT